MIKQKRLAYEIPFKLEVVQYAKEHGNRAAERHFGPHPSEKMIREWRKQEDRLQKADKSKHTFRGAAAKWPQLEMDVKEWIIRQQNNGFSVSANMIIFEAKRISIEKGIQDFTGSLSWCYRFMRRCGLATRAKTRIAPKLPKGYESKFLSFHKFVIDARKKNGFEIGQIGNMDEVPLTFDVPSNRTVDLMGATVKNSGHEKAHYTTVLSCCADGTKLPPMLIFKSKTFPKEVIPPGVVVHVHEKGWMDENGMRTWVEKVWSKRPGGLQKKPALLVLDQFRAHVSEPTKKCFEEVKTHLAVIPRGLTSQLQPLDVSISKPFKVLMKKEWNKWAAAGNHYWTPAGGMKIPALAQVCEWVKTSWDSVKEEIVVRSFKKCGISNALDGSEDDIFLYEDSEESDVSDCEQMSFLNSDSSDGARSIPAPNTLSSLPCDGEESDQSPVAFEEVVVFFTQEEWTLLNLDQKALHQEVMEENWKTVLSLEAGRMRATSIPSSVPRDGEKSKQGPVAFKEVAVFFTQKEWTLLDCDQKSLHQEVMEENWKTVLSLENNWSEKNLCPRYGGIFMHKAELAGHQRTHTEESCTQEEPYECINKRFITEVSGKCLDHSLHMSLRRLHKGGKRYNYQECGKASSRNSNLLIHQSVHTGETLYKCQDCGKCFSQNSTLVIHTGEKACKCYEGGKCFVYNSQLMTHQKIHTGEKLYKCQECGKCYAHLSQLLSHNRIHTGEKPYKCQECGKYFAQHSQLVSHNRVHTGEKPYKCQECGRCFAQTSDLVSHKRIHTGEKPYKCQECGKCYAHSSVLVKHKRAHTGEKPYRCEECGKCFACSSLLLKHRRVHTGEKPYKCQECGKCFAQNSDLVGHQRRVHTGEKPYKCQECGKCFTDSSLLSKHRRVHTGEKPYKCQECGKCFSQNSNLVGHKKVHTGEKPYKCQDCDKCFARNSDLLNHKRLHTGEKPYKCLECGKSFVRSSELACHKRVHTGDNPYKCPKCGKCFPRNSHLVGHQKIHVKEKPLKSQ
ncbi:uncharacterized protein LOC110070281 isoform X2 [Pogona vitticeps]